MAGFLVTGINVILFYHFQSVHKIKDICSKANISMPKAALSWVLQQNENSCAIVGCQTPEQVVDNSSIVKLSPVS